MVYLGDPPKRRRKIGGMIGVKETARRNIKSSRDKWYEVKGVDTRKFSPKVNKYNPEAVLDGLIKTKKDKGGK